MTTLSDGTTTVEPIFATGYESTRDAQNVLHVIIGRPNVEPTLRPAGLRTGTLTFLFDSLEDGLTAEALVAQAKVLTLADADRPALGMNFVASGKITLALDEDSRTLWTLAVEFTEVT